MIFLFQIPKNSICEILECNEAFWLSPEYASPREKSLLANCYFVQSPSIILLLPFFILHKAGGKLYPTKLAPKHVVNLLFSISPLLLFSPISPFFHLNVCAHAGGDFLLREIHSLCNLSQSVNAIPKDDERSFVYIGNPRSRPC